MHFWSNVFGPGNVAEQASSSLADISFILIVCFGVGIIVNSEVDRKTKGMIYTQSQL